METVTTIGLDIAKSVFQVHGVDAAGQVVVRRQLKRRYVLAFFQKLPPCLVGIEACASAHHWARELQVLERDRFILKRIRHLRSSLRTRLVRRSGGEHRSASRWLRRFALRLYATRS